MAGDIKCIRLIVYYNKFDECKDKIKSIAIHKVILKYITNEWELPKEKDAENDADLLNIYGGNINSWYLLVISLTHITFDLVRNCN